MDEKECKKMWYLLKESLLKDIKSNKRPFGHPAKWECEVIIEKDLEFLKLMSHIEVSVALGGIHDGK